MQNTQEQVSKALGRIPSGCAILTARAGTRRTGMLASWIQQVAFEPPMVMAAVKRGRPIGDIISESGEFAVNLLGENPAAMFKHFGKGFSQEEDAFAGLKSRDVACGVEIGEQVARLSLRVRMRVEAGDHDVLIGEVVDASVSSELAPPYVHIRKNGLSY